MLWIIRHYCYYFLVIPWQCTETTAGGPYVVGIEPWVVAKITACKLSILLAVLSLCIRSAFYFYFICFVFQPHQAKAYCWFWTQESLLAIRKQYGVLKDWSQVDCVQGKRSLPTVLSHKTSALNRTTPTHWALEHCEDFNSSSNSMSSWLGKQIIHSAGARKSKWNLSIFVVISHTCSCSCFAAANTCPNLFSQRPAAVSRQLPQTTSQGRQVKFLTLPVPGLEERSSCGAPVS